MLYDNINKLIAEALKKYSDKSLTSEEKNKAEIRLSTLRLIKSKYMEFSTSADKGDKTITEAVEVNILRKMVAERKDDLGMFLAAGRTELVEKAKLEIEIISEFLPEDVSEEKLIEAFNDVLATGIEPIRKNMGMFIKAIKEKYPIADGKTISTIVAQRLK